jgi:hypothetical protein
MCECNDPLPAVLLGGFHAGLCIGAVYTGHYPLAVAFGGCAVVLGGCAVLFALVWYNGRRLSEKE